MHGVLSAYESHGVEPLKGQHKSWLHSFKGLTKLSLDSLQGHIVISFKTNNDDRGRI
jgi:hypothetical protein